MVRDIIAQLLRQNKIIKRADNSPAGKSLETKFKRKTEADARAQAPKKGGRGANEEGGSNWDHSYSAAANSDSAQGQKGKPPMDPRTLTGPCYFCRGPHIQKFCPKLKEQTAEIQAAIEKPVADAKA
jgi:hypothetical protein